MTMINVLLTNASVINVESTIILPQFGNRKQSKKWTVLTRKSTHQVQMTASQNLTYLVFVLKATGPNKTATTNAKIT